MSYTRFMNFVPTTLAIDFGTRRVGVAISMATLAEPLTVLPNDQWLLDQLQQLIASHQVQQVVIGVSEAEMAETTRAFAAQLESALQSRVPMYFVDETLSSAETHAKLRQPGIKRSKRQGPIDHYAAASFLQDWLEMRYTNNHEAD